MKRIFLLFVLSFVFVGGAFAQKQSVTDPFGNSIDPKPLSTTTVSCPPLTLVISGTDPLCNGAADGTASVSVSGGTLPYTYLWSPSGQTTANATGLVGNTYVIEVWDNTGINYCSGSIALVNPASLIVNITPPAPVSSCFGYCDGSATASPTGGTAPYSYSWNTGPVQTTALATGLCSQLYTITMTDGNGCVKVKNVFIGQPALLVSNGASTTINCSGNCNGTASVAPSGGNPPYTYSWSTGATTTGISALCVGNYTCGVTDTKGCFASYSTTITAPTSVSVTISGTNLLCNAVCIGTASVVASGGTPPYAYSWSSGGTNSSVSGLCANTYSCTVTDGNNCALTRTITISQPTAITTAPTGTNLSCFNQCNGTASANAGGGTAPYTYSWSGGCTTSVCSNLCSGGYTVSVSDASGCAVSGNVTLNQPALLTATPSKSDATCFGSCNGSMSVVAVGGTSPYSYNWSSGCTTSACAGMCVGNYTITITDTQSCVATATIAVSSPNVLLTNLSSVPASCFGTCDGKAIATPSGGTAPYTYAWSGGCNTSTCVGLCAANYTLNLTDANGCPSTNTVSVSQPALFTAVVSSATPNPLNCNGDCNGTALATLGGGTPVYSYLWSNGQTTASATGLCAGTYSLSATDANGCPANTTVTFTAPTTLSVSIATFNPTCGGSCNGVIIATPGGGTPGYTYAWLPGGQTGFSIAGLCSGNYTLTVTDSKGCSNTQVVTITAPSVLDANVSVLNNVSCSGFCDGAAISNPTGGTAPFTYSWSNGNTSQTATGFCLGLKTITVIDANGCPDVDFFLITQPAVLSSVVSSSTSSCGACTGTASLTTSGGTAPYTFLWSPSAQTTSAATGLCAGTYTVNITDSKGCGTSVVTSISSAITSTVTVSGPSVSCATSCDGNATATPFGGTAPFTYLWNSAPTQSTQSASGLCAGNYTMTLTDFNGCVTTNTLSFTSPTAVTTTISSTSASCGLCNGTTTIAASGGTGSYSYTWSGFPTQTTATAIGLCSGNYTITVKDANNCATTNTVAVGNVPTISDNASTTLATCGVNNDGAICLAPSGGVPGYTYSWAPGGETVSCISNLSAGVYTVTISDAAACAANFPIAIGTTNGPTVTVTSQVNPTCNAGCDGSIAVSAAGSSPFTYLWNPGGQTTTSVSALCSGTYNIQVDDNVPCTAFASVTLSSPPQISPNPTVTNLTCSGGSNGNICLAPTGGTAPYTYEWLPGGQTTSCRNALSAGTYSVVVKDANACDDTLAIVVSAPATLSVSIASTNVNCNGNGNGTATATVTGGTTLYTYAWSTGSGLPGIVGLVPNNYSITVTDANGCTGTGSVTISQPAVLSTTVTSNNISCNSLCDGNATLTASGGTGTYTYNWLPGAQTTSTATGLCVGNYNGTITDANGCASSQTVAISQPTAITATVTSANASCFSGCDGTASANVAGGTGTYTYSWNPGGLTGASVTGLCANSYTLTTSDANGCSATNLFSIAAPAVLQANVTSTQPSCTGICNATATSAPVGGTGAYTYQWSNGQTTATATGLCAANYTLTLSDANACAVTQVVTIAAPTPVAQASAVSGATCLLCNGSITVVGSGGTSPYSFFWSTGATTGTITGLCSGVYIDTVMDANGCMSIDTMGVSNVTGPTITLAKTNVTCFGACDGTVSVATAVGDGPAWGYFWSFTTPSQTTQLVTGLCPNQYFASVTDTLGCKTVQPITITEPAQLASNPAVTNATCFGICDGSILTAATGGTGAYTYNWLPGGETTSSITSQCAGSYTLTLLDANNCSFTTTVTIGQNTILSATVTSTNNSCNASCNGTATLTISGGTAPYSYSWTGGQTTSAATGLCAGGYTVTANDAIGCLSINTVTITEPAVLAANVTSTNPLCNAACNGTVNSVPTGGTSPYTYLWMPGSSTTSSSSGLCAGTYTLTLTDANNCASTNTLTLTDPAVLAATSTVTPASCANTCNGSIGITTAGGTMPYTFLWSPTANTTEDVTGLCPGNHTVSITDANSCNATYTMNVGITTLVVSNAGNDTSFCIGGTATLNNSSTNATSIGWYQMTTPSWTFVGSTNSINVSPLAGIYNYGLIALNGICSDTDTVMVTVNNYPVVVANNTTICAGGSASICASGANAYQWFQLPAWTPIATGTCINVSPAIGVTNYGIIGMNGVCSDTDSVAVTVLAIPIANAGADTAFCSGTSVTLCGTLSQNGLIFNWFTLPLWTPGDTDTCYTVSPFITTDYALIVSNGACSDTDTVNVTVYPGPTADAGSNVTVLASANTVLNGTGGGSYLWSPAAGLSNTTIANPVANPTVTTTYMLLVTDTNGCTSIDSIKITVITVVTPNDGLSPNGDGINDVWIIPNIEQFPDALVEVYNRWGELLFHSIGYTIPWDATYKGKELPVGTYYYVINLNSDLKPDPITGPITILR